MLEPKSVTVPLVAGLDETTSKEGDNASGFLTLTNCEWRSADAAARRPGLDQHTSIGVLVPAQGLVTDGHALGMMVATGGLQNILPGLPNSSVPAANGYIRQRTVTTTFTGERVIGADGAVGVTTAGVRVSLIAVSQDDNTVHWRVVDHETGNQSGLAGTITGALRARTVYVPGATPYFVMVWQDSGTGTKPIRMLTINLATMVASATSRVDNTYPALATAGWVTHDVVVGTRGGAPEVYILWRNTSNHPTLVAFRLASGLVGEDQDTGITFTTGDLAVTSNLAMAWHDGTNYRGRFYVFNGTIFTVTRDTAGPWTFGIQDGHVAVLSNAGLDYAYADDLFALNVTSGSWNTAGTAVVTGPVLRRVHLATKPLAGPNSTLVGVTAQNASTSGYRSIQLMDPNVTVPYGSIAFDEASYAPDYFPQWSVLAGEALATVTVPADLESAPAPELSNPISRARTVEICFNIVANSARYAEPIGATTINDLGLVVGSGPKFYVGSDLIPAGFAGAPDAPALTISGAGVLTGTYTYVVVLEFYSASGHIGVSPVSQSAEIVLTADTAQAVISAPFAPTGTYAKLYRNTVAAPAVFHLIARELLGTSVTIADNVADAVAELGETLYTTGGILPSEPAPPLRHACAHRNRIIGIRADEPRTIVYTKEVESPLLPQWNSELSFRIDNQGGEPTAVASLDDKILIFQAEQICVVNGAGKDALGQGGFQQPEQFAAGVGVGEGQGQTVAVFPDGVLFYHRTGIFLVNKALAVLPIGLPVQRQLLTLGPAYTATYIPSRHQVWFLQATQALVFDTRFQRWSVYTSAGLLPQDVVEVDGTVYLLVVGGLLKLTPGVYTDYPDGSTPSHFTQVIEPPWFRPGQRGGTHRLWHAGLSGTMLHAAGLTVALEAFVQRTWRSGYDTGSSVDTLTWPAAELAQFVDGQGFSVADRLRSQRASATRCKITVTPSVVDVDTLELSTIHYDFGVEPSRSKTPAGRRANRT